MAYSKTKPADSDLISDSASDLRDNFAAIEEGGVDHEKVTLSNSNPPATGATDKGAVYAKDVSSKAELHYIDEDNNSIQMTSGGSLGASTTAVEFDTLSHDSGTTTYNENNFVTAWALCDGASSGATLIDNSGFSGVSVSSSVWTFTFSTALDSANYAVIGTSVDGTSSNIRSVKVVSRATGSFSVKVLGVGNDKKSGDEFSVVVLGGR